MKENKVTFNIRTESLISVSVTPCIYRRECSLFRNNYPGVMAPGMIFTVEPAISEGTDQIYLLEDGWTAVTRDGSRSAQFEHTVLVTGTLHYSLAENSERRNTKLQNVDICSKNWSLFKTIFILYRTKGNTSSFWN